MADDKSEPFNLSRPPHLLANDLLNRIEIRNACQFGRETHNDVEQLIRQLRNARISGEEDRTAKLERIAVLADALLDAFYEFNGEGNASLASATGEYVDALHDAIARLGEEELVRLKFPQQ